MAAPGNAYFVGWTLRLNWAATDFSPPNLLATKLLKLPPLLPVELAQPAGARWVVTDFHPRNLLTGVLPQPPLVPLEGTVRLSARGVFTDFIPPNLLAARFLPSPPVGAVDLSQQIQFRSIGSSFEPPNLTLRLPVPPITPREWGLRLEVRGVYSDFAPPNLVLATLRPTPLRPQDLSGMRLYTHSLADFVAPNLLTGPLASGPVVSSAAGRHQSRAAAHQRRHLDVLRARVLQDQCRDAERALIDCEDRELRARAKVLTRVRVRPGLRKPLAQFAPVIRAAIQRRAAHDRHRALLAEFERLNGERLAREDAEAAQYLLQTLLWDDRERDREDEEAALHLMHFLTWERWT